jgi:hypothetical protein
MYSTARQNALRIKPSHFIRDREILGWGSNYQLQKQECTNPGDYVAVATKFCTVAPNILVPQYEIFFMSPFKILKWLLQEILCTPL